MNKRLVAKELIRIAKMLRASEELSQEAKQFLLAYDGLIIEASNRKKDFRVYGNFQPPNEFLVLSTDNIYNYSIDGCPKKYLRNLIEKVNVIKEDNAQLVKLYKNLSKEAKSEVNKIVPKGESFGTLHSAGIFD